MKTLLTIIKTTVLIFALFIGWVFMTCDIMAGAMWVILCMTSYGTVYGMIEEYREKKAKGLKWYE